MIANAFSGAYSNFYQNPKTLVLEPSSTVNAAPWTIPPVDTYGRVSWHSLEADGEGRFNFSAINRVLAGLALGQRFSFRVVAFNPQKDADTNVVTGEDGFRVYSDVPAYLETRAHGWLLPIDPRDTTLGHYFIPDWNDPYVLQRMAALVTALGQAFDGDARVGWVDIGLYGSWGEWHTEGLPSQSEYSSGIPYDKAERYYSINQQQYLLNKGTQGAYAAGSPRSKIEIARDFISTFQTTQLLALTDDGNELCYALGQSSRTRPIGLRRDSLGSGIGSFYWQFPNKLPNCHAVDDIRAILSRWRMAPFITETYGNGASPSFPCQTFEQFQPRDMSYAYNCSVAQWGGAIPNYCIDEEVLDTHVAAIKNAALCKDGWDSYPAVEQQAFIRAKLYAGYRFAPIRITVSLELNKRNTLSVETRWVNYGVTPAYNDWQVRYRMSPIDRELGSPTVTWTSKIDFRSVLPTGRAPFARQTPVVVYDKVRLSQALTAGAYELHVVVQDRSGYLAPMQLAIEGREAEGGYLLGQITIPDHRL